MALSLQALRSLSLAAVENTGTALSGVLTSVNTKLTTS
jgi:hypothetical protein